MPVPGAISLAHKGVLFLDEMAEFKREALDSMRQPLEEKRIQITRNTGTFTYPADFMLVGAMNLCPCGYFPDMGKCHCSLKERKRYRNRVSGPILDRMDICMVVEPVKIEIFSGKKAGKAITSKTMADMVKEARSLQEERYRGTDIHQNGHLRGHSIKEYCQLDRATERMLEEIFQKRSMTPRAYFGILKISRTIADLEKSSKIRKEHVMEALSYSVDLESLNGEFS